MPADLRPFFEGEDEDSFADPVDGDGRTILEELAADLDGGLPRDLLAFWEASDGFNGDLHDPSDPDETVYLRLHEAEEMAERTDDSEILGEGGLLSGGVEIGDNGGDESIVLAPRNGRLRYLLVDQGADEVLADLGGSLAECLHGLLHEDD